jgi:hypothetical protein
LETFLSIVVSVSLSLRGREGEMSPAKVVVLIVASWVSALALAASAPSAALLPRSFGGWTETATPPVPDAENEAVLHEYGLSQSATATYTAGSRSMGVAAWRFADATGAYGAFTFFREPNMHVLSIGHECAAVGDHYLFWSGTTVVDVNFASPSGDEQAAIIGLARQIPQAAGTAGIPPSLPHYLPAAQLDPVTVHYVIGPAAWARLGEQLPVSVIDFSQDTEVVTARYGPFGSSGTLTLLSYPTPQIAAAHLKSIDALAQPAGFAARRSGPIVAMVSGSPSSASAQQLLNAVHFNDYVTINHPEGYVPETVKLYRLLVGITMLVVILVSAALLLGIFLGGGRALVRLMRGKPVSAVSEEEFISLHLSQ